MRDMLENLKVEAEKNEVLEADWMESRCEEDSRKCKYVINL